MDFHSFCRALSVYALYFINLFLSRVGRHLKIVESDEKYVKNCAYQPCLLCRFELGILKKLHHKIKKKSSLFFPRLSLNIQYCLFIMFGVVKELAASPPTHTHTDLENEALSFKNTPKLSGYGAVCV